MKKILNNIHVVPSSQRNLDKSEFNGKQLVKDRKAKNINFVLLYDNDQVLTNSMSVVC